MGISRQFKEKLAHYSSDEIARIVRMGWEDRTSFESIRAQFGLTENECVRLMRTHLSAADFARWRKRIHHRGRLKNAAKSGIASLRYKCSRQSVDGITKGWK